MRVKDDHHILNRRENAANLFMPGGDRYATKLFAKCNRTIPAPGGLSATSEAT